MVREVKVRYCLKHKGGLYLSWDSDEYPLTKKISKARRFPSLDHLNMFLMVSSYRPTELGFSDEDFKIQPIEVEYREREADE